MRRLLACLFGGERLQVSGEGVDGTGEGLPGDGGAGGRVGAEFADPQGQRGEADGGEHALLVTLLFGDGVNQHGVDSRLVEHASQVVFDGFFVAFGHAVEHYGDCDGACGGLVEQFPGHGVGVAVGGGDEEPQVCGGEQLLGEGAVFLGDGVDIGRVNERNALRQRRGSNRNEGARNLRVEAG